jgi:large subunit ribosomal protein L33
VRPAWPGRGTGHPFPEAVMAVKGKGKRINIKLKSSESPHMYYTTKNKQKQPGRLEIKKYDPVVRKHVVYKESR